VGYKEELAWIAEAYSTEYYLNHVGYKAFLISLPKTGIPLKYYLNHVGYKALGAILDGDLYFAVLSEPCGI